MAKFAVYVYLRFAPAIEACAPMLLTEYSPVGLL